MTFEYAGSIFQFVLISIFCLLVVNGIVVNVFIVMVNITCWKRSQPLKAIDSIITSLATVRIILLLLYILFLIDILSSQSITKMDMSPEHTITLTLSVEFCSLWWGSVLCVFYCVKITNYSNRLFMRLKMNISKMVPWLLLISLVPSLLSSLPYRLVFYTQYFNGTDGPTEVIKTNWFKYFIIYCAGSITPFVIFCISIGLVIVSLLRHTRHLSSKGSRFSDAQRDVHLGVIRNMFSCLLFYVLYFIGSNLLPVSVMFKKQLLTVLCSIFYVAFPSLHSIFLVVFNRKLKNSFLTVLRCSWIRDRKQQSS